MRKLLRLPARAGRAGARLGKRIIRLTMLATVAGAIVLVLDVLLLGNTRRRDGRAPH